MHLLINKSKTECFLTFFWDLKRTYFGMYHTSTVDIVQCNLFSEYDALIENHGIPLKSFHMLHGYYDIILLTVCQACKKKITFYGIQCP